MTLKLDGLTHSYGAERTIEDVSFGLDAGELVALLGPSGCGKTTVVQAIAGHVRPTGGRVLLRNRDVTDEPPESRRVGVVFQESTLYPHMTVAENVAYGLQNVESEARDARVREYLDLVDLGGQEESHPNELSGGQKRRAELARALAPRPDVLLLDEPLSALDRSLRERLQNEIARIQRETGVTTLFVTHDQSEAMALADRLVVMNDGQVAGIGDPRTLYESPPTAFVSSFLGRSNAFAASVVDSRPLRLRIGDRELSLDESTERPADGEDVVCHVRPKDLSFAGRSGNGSHPTVSGVVSRVADLGRRYDVTVRIGGGEELVVEHTGRPPSTGAAVDVTIPPDAITFFDGEAEVPVAGRG